MKAKRPTPVAAIEVTTLLKSLSSLKLCKECAARQGLSQGYAARIAVPAARCQICHGILSEIDSLANEICARLEGYEFDNFLVGARIPQAILDSEDEMRSELKIRGEENLKTQLTRAVGKQVAERSGKPVNYKRPDITVLVSTADRSVAIDPRSLWISARYQKKTRGLPQRSSVCATCNGVGCVQCDYKGASVNSVEFIARDYFKRLFQAEDCNFIWLGSEDHQSLVLGDGRPFFAEIVSPHMRHVSIQSQSILASNTPEKQNGIRITINEILPSKPPHIPTFSVRCRAYLCPGDGVKVGSVAKEELEKKFSNTTVQVRLSRKSKIVIKKIERVKLLQDGHRLVIEVECDGGIPIKKLVIGTDSTVTPNLSNYFEGYSMDPEKAFDILDISLDGQKNSAPSTMESDFEIERFSELIDDERKDRPLLVGS